MVTKKGARPAVPSALPSQVPDPPLIILLLWHARPTAVNDQGVPHNGENLARR